MSTDKQDQQYIDTTKAWIKTQKHSINSCELAIKQYTEQIKHLQKAIALEKVERNMKILQLAIVKKDLKKYSK